MYGQTIYLDSERRHGVKVKGLDFSLETVCHQGYFNETHCQNKLSGKVSIQIVRNTKIQDYTFFKKPHVMPYYENREIPVNDLPDELKQRMIDLWADIEKELANTEVVFKDVGKN